MGVDVLAEVGSSAGCGGRFVAMSEIALCVLKRVVGAVWAGCLHLLILTCSTTVYRDAGVESLEEVGLECPGRAMVRYNDDVGC